MNYQESADVIVLDKRKDRTLISFCTGRINKAKKQKAVKRGSLRGKYGWKPETRQKRRAKI